MISQAMENIFSPELENYKFDVFVRDGTDAKGSFKSLNLKKDHINSAYNSGEHFIQQSELLRFYIESNTFVFFLPHYLREVVKPKKWGSSVNVYDATYCIPRGRENATLWELTDLKYLDEKIEFYRIVRTVIEHAVEKCKCEPMSLN
jgi:uncharacterized protein YheU (UPF0270 family)